MAGLLDRLPAPILWRRPKVHKFPSFGGDVRSAVLGPGRIRQMLARLSFIRTTITATLFLLGLVNAVLILRLITLLDTELIVSDGSVFGCRLPSIMVGG
jgi:hypothetical protein